MQVGERQHFARHGAIAREAAERSLRRQRILFRLAKLGAKRAHPDQLLGRGLGQLLEPGQRDPVALDLAGQRHRLAEQPRGFVGTAAELARQHRLGLGEAGPHHQLAGLENLVGRRRVGALLQQDVEVGPKHPREGWRQVAGVGPGFDDLAEHRFGGRQLAGAREVAGQPGARVEQSGGAGIAGLEHRHALAV